MIIRMSFRCRRYAVSLAAAFLLVFGFARSALAKSYDVEVVTEPSGAKVYLGKDGKLLGKTPYRGKLDAGEYTFYITKRGFESMYQSVVVKKKSGRQEFSYELKEVQYGRVEVVAADNAEPIDDARILIDGEEVGNAPDIIDPVSVGPHQVEVIREGYEIFEQWIEVEKGVMTTVEVELEEDPDAIYGSKGGKGSEGDEDEEDAPDAPDEDDDGEEDDEDDDVDDSPDFVMPPVADVMTRPYVILGIGPEVGNRNFEYVIPEGVNDAPNIRPYDAALVPLARVRLQVYPLAGSATPALAGWGFSGSYAQAKSVTSQTEDNQTLDTRWNEWDANLRFMLPLGKATIAAEVGYAGQTFEFEAGEGVGMLIDEVPGVEYRFTRVGGDVAFQFTPKIGAWIGGNYRIVSALGKLSTRFEETQVTAYGGQAGANYGITDSIQVQLLLNFSRYQHLFIIRNDGDMARVAGTDQFVGAMLGLAYLR